MKFMTKNTDLKLLSRTCNLTHVMDILFKFWGMTYLSQDELLNIFHMFQLSASTLES